jgi:cytochrome c biogenesis protein ResB
VRAPFRFLRSIKLAIGLIAYLSLACVLASLLPQAREDSFYYAALPGALAALVVKTGFSNYFRSLLFLIPAFLLFANLSACSAGRLAAQLKKGRRERRHGPDILHLGLVLLFLGAVLGQAAKAGRPDWDGFVRLGVGESVQLPGDRLLTLSGLEAQRYDDGRPRDWISTVSLSKDGKGLGPERAIRVNHPLRLGALSIYQASYGVDRVLELAAPSGETRSLATGESLATDSGRILLMSVDLDTDSALASEEGPGGTRTLRLEKGEKAGAFTVIGAKEIGLSGLRASYDPAFPAILAALAISALGIFITFARKIGDMRP